MGKSIGIVCGAFHKTEVEQMLAFATDEATKLGMDIGQVVWVPGAMEVPLAINRLLSNEELDGAACLGII